jgi:hypothetical protein
MSVPHPAFVLDDNKQYVYCHSMIRSFANSETEHFFSTGKSRRLPSEILKRAAMRLLQPVGRVSVRA